MKPSCVLADTRDFIEVMKRALTLSSLQEGSLKAKIVLSRFLQFLHKSFLDQWIENKKKEICF